MTPTPKLSLKRNSTGYMRNYSKTKTGRKVTETQAAALFRKNKNRQQLQTLFDELKRSRSPHSSIPTRKTNSSNRVKSTAAKTIQSSARKYLSQVKSKKTIAAKTIQRSYRRSKARKPECAICLDTNANYTLNCKHSFHKNCLAQMLTMKRSNTNSKPRCPLCRANITNKNKMNVLSVLNNGYVDIRVLVKPSYKIYLKRRMGSNYDKTIHDREHTQFIGTFKGPFIKRANSIYKVPHGKGVFISENKQLVYIGNMLNSFTLQNGNTKQLSGEGLIYEAKQRKKRTRGNPGINLSGDLLKDLKDESVEYVYYGGFVNNRPKGMGILLKCPEKDVFELTYAYFTYEGPMEALPFENFSRKDEKFKSLNRALKSPLMKQIIDFSTSP